MEAYRCQRCGRTEHLYYRRESGETLCRSCLERSIVRRVKRTISKFNMLEPTGTILIVLDPHHVRIAEPIIRVMSVIESKYPTEMHVVLLSKACVNALKTTLSSRIKVLILEGLSGDVHSHDIELERRSLRRRVLELARERGFGHPLRVVMPYTLDDEAWLVLEGLLRASPSLLEEARPVIEDDGVKFVKPFIYVRRAELEFLAGAIGGPSGRRRLAERFLEELEREIPTVKYSVLSTLDSLLRLLR